MLRQGLIVAASEGLPSAAKVFRRRPLPGGGLYRLSCLTRPKVRSVARDLASVAVLVV